MKKSAFLSLGLLLLIAAWMLSGVFAKAPETSGNASVNMPTRTQFMKVSVQEIHAREISREIVVQGELEPRRQVTVKAQISSIVVALPTARGSRVETGTTLVKLAEEDRMAQLTQAHAEVTSHQLEVAARRTLKQKGLQAENLLKSAEAALAAAQARLKRAELELEHLSIDSPFDGILEQRHVEIGSHVDRGDPVALVVDKSLIKAVGNISQQSAGQLKLGQTTRIRLLDGRKATGKITYISRIGDTQTHSFRVEAEIANEAGLINPGVSAEISITVGREYAHFLTPSILSLNEQGVIGVKSIDSNNLVQFHPVELVRTEAEGVWLSGLPEITTVIVQGQGFVNTGDEVVPVGIDRG